MPALDRYSALGPSASGPSELFFPIVPADGADLAYRTTAIVVGGAGSVTALCDKTGATVRFTSLSAGAILPIRTSRVLATGTSATDLVGLG